jgi:hypothetical protein
MHEKKRKKLTSERARHMTSDEILDLLARDDWETMMKEVFKEVGPWFRVLKKSIADYQKAIEKEKKAAKCEAKKVAAAEARAGRAHGRGRGTGGGGRGRGRGRGRGGRGRVAGAAGGVDDDDLSPNYDSSGTARSSSRSSNSGSESEAEIPILCSCRQRPVQLIRAQPDVAVEDNANPPSEPELPRMVVAAQPRPRPRMIHNPSKARAVNNGDDDDDTNQPPEPEIPIQHVATHAPLNPHMIDHQTKSEEVDAERNTACNNLGAERDSHVDVQAVQRRREAGPPEIRVSTGPGGVETVLDVQGGLVRPKVVEAGEGDIQMARPQHRNPKHGKQPDN